MKKIKWAKEWSHKGNKKDQNGILFGFYRCTFNRKACLNSIRQAFFICTFFKSHNLHPISGNFHPFVDSQTCRFLQAIAFCFLRFPFFGRSRRKEILI